jgi:hypothetical protein
MLPLNWIAAPCLFLYGVCHRGKEMLGKAAVGGIE